MRIESKAQLMKLLAEKLDIEALKAIDDFLETLERVSYEEGYSDCYNFG